jgi:hypothetical protein
MTSFFDPFLRFVLLPALLISCTAMIFYVLELIYIYSKNSLRCEALASPPLHNFSRQIAAVSANSEPGVYRPGFM